MTLDDNCQSTSSFFKALDDIREGQDSLAFCAKVNLMITIKDETKNDSSPVCRGHRDQITPSVFWSKWSCRSCRSIRESTFRDNISQVDRALS